MTSHSAEQPNNRLLTYVWSSWLMQEIPPSKLPWCDVTGASFASGSAFARLIRTHGDEVFEVLPERKWRSMKNDIKTWRYLNLGFMTCTTKIAYMELDTAAAPWLKINMTIFSPWFSIAAACEIVSGKPDSVRKTSANAFSGMHHLWSPESKSIINRTSLIPPQLLDVMLVCTSNYLQV